MKQGTYIGTDERLKDCRALIRKSPSLSKLLAQFDDLELSESHGWHEFDQKDFDVDLDEEKLSKCQFCGCFFEQEKLGKYGCPNCCGEGL